MAKMNFKDLFLAKGDKLLLFSGLGLGGLLLAGGVMAALGAGDPTAEAKTMTDKARGLDSKRADDTVPDDLKKPLPVPGTKFVIVPTDDFHTRSDQFEVTIWPSLRRDNPVALMPTDSQIDFVQGSVKMFGRENFVFDKDTGELVDFTQLVLAKKPETVKDANAIRSILKDDFGKKKRQRAPVALRGGMQPGGGMPGEGGPGGGGPGMGGPGGGRGRGMGMMMQGGPGGMGGASQTSEGDVVVWEKYSDSLKADTPKVPAYMVYPTRMAVVQLSFPLKAQLEEIKRALRLRTLAEAIVESGPGAVYMKDPQTGQPVTFTGGGAMPGGMMPGGMMPGGMQPGMPGGPAGMKGGPGGGLPGEGSGSGSLSALGNIAAPVFAGFTVERRTILSDGTPMQWELFDHAGYWNEEFGLYDAEVLPEGGYLPYFLRPEQDLVAPLPVFTSNWSSIPQDATLPKTNYPEDIRLAPIIADYQRLVEEKKKGIPKDQFLERYKKNPGGSYSGVNTRSGAAGGIPGAGGGEGYGGRSGFGMMPGGGMGSPDGGDGRGYGRGGQIPGMPGGPGMGGPGMGGPGMGGPMGGGTLTTTNPLPVDNLLIRFLDTKLEPGLSYQYRVSVKIRNPNYNKPEKVSRKDLAAEEFVTSKPFQVRQTLRVPYENFLFAYSPKKYEANVTTMTEPFKGNSGTTVQVDLLRKMTEVKDVTEGRKAVVQVQKWVEQTMFGEVREPVGAWVQAELPVGVGEYIGKKMLVELPLWRATLGTHVLTPPNENAKLKLIKNWPAKTPEPLGRPVDFTTNHVLLDFEGGKVNPKVGGQTVSDEAGTELLILREDGRIEVRKEVVDAERKDRVGREKGWKDWVDLVKKSGPGNANGVGPGGFPGGRGSGTPGGGGTPDGN